MVEGLWVFQSKNTLQQEREEVLRNMRVHLQAGERRTTASPDEVMSSLHRFCSAGLQKVLFICWLLGRPEQDR